MQGGLCCLLNDSMLESLNACQEYLAPCNYGGFDAFWNITADSIVLGEQLGTGHFGKVFAGHFQHNTDCQVAIKFLKSNGANFQTADNEFRKETTFMKKLNHQFIVQLLGVCLDSEHGHGIVTELMENSLVF